MTPFERFISKLSENHKIVEIGSTEFKLWQLIDVPKPLGSYYTLVPLVTFATVDFVYNYKQATPLTWAVIIIEGVLVVSVHT